MSRLRADKIVNRTAAGAPELTFGADIPVSGSLTGAGGVNITGVCTAGKFVGDGSGLSGVTASGTGIVVYDESALVGTAGTFVFGTNVNVTPVSAGVATITSVNTDTNTTYGMLSVLDGTNVKLRLSGSDASEDDTIITAGSGIAFAGVTASGFTIESSLSGLANVVEDVSPQLGGNLDLNSKTITGTGGISITGGVSATIFTGAFNGPSNGLSGTPDITVGDIVGAGASFSGNVSIGGTLTYEDVTNIDVVGVSTFNHEAYFLGDFGPDPSEGFKGCWWDPTWSAWQFGSESKIYFSPSGTVGSGVTIAGPGASLEVYGNTDFGFLAAKQGMFIRAGAYGDTGKVITIEGKQNQESIKITGDAGVDISYSGNKKIETTNTGVIVTGILTATTIKGNLDADEITVGSSVGIGTSGGSWTTSAGTPQDLDVFTVSTDNRKTSEYTIYLQNGSNQQAQKVLVMQDGSNAFYEEYAIMAAPNKIVSFSATIINGECKLRATPESGITGVATYNIVRQSIA